MTAFPSLPVGVLRRYYLMQALYGITATTDTYSLNATGSLPSGQMHAGAVYLFAGEVVANLGVDVQVAATGAAPTLIKLGLWTSAATPACVAVTADLSADTKWTSTGKKVFALTGSYTVPTSGIYYIAILKNGAFGGTDVSLGQATPATVSSGSPVGSNPYSFTLFGTGKTNMAVADTATYATSGRPYWFMAS